MRSVFQEKTLDRVYQNQQNDVQLKPFYTVVVNSLQTATRTGTGANICSYRFDWTQIPDCPYEVHFTYIGELNNVDYSSLPMVYAEFGVQSNVYEAKASNAVQMSQYLGFLETYLVGASSFLHAEDGTNTPIYLAGRPSNNQFNIKILDNAGNPYTAAGATALNEYILTMNFYPRINVNNSMSS